MVEGSVREEQGKAASQVRLALWVYSALVAMVTGLSWGVYRIHGDFLLRPLFGADNRFNDLMAFSGKVMHLYHASAELGRGMPQYTYPAPSAFVYHFLLFSFPGHAVRMYLAILVVAVCCFGWIAWKASRPDKEIQLAAAAAILTTATLCFPLWYAGYMGNLEIVVWIFSGVGICCLLRGRYAAGAVFIGLAASVKPFPMLFLLLLLRRKKYKEAILGVATAALITVAALIELGPNPVRAYDNLKPGVDIYMRAYIFDFRPADEERFLHSLLDAMKSSALTVEMRGLRPHKAVEEISRLQKIPEGWPPIRTLVRIYPFLATAGFGLLLWVFYDKPFLNQLTALAVSATLFPLSAAEYTLLYLFVPFGAFLIFLTREVAQGAATLDGKAIFLLSGIYALLFSPLTLLMIYAGDAKTLLLIALLVVVARAPMESIYFGGGETQRVLSR